MATWSRANLESADGNTPFSFVFAGRPSSQVLSGWSKQSATRRLDARRTQRTTVWTDPVSKVQVRCVAIVYKDFPAAEWTVYVRNAGSKDSPIIERLQALDGELPKLGSGDFVLHHNVGSPASRSDYMPLETPLPIGAVKRIGAAGGRPTNSDLSYFNLSSGDAGTIVVVGWPGQWSAEFSRRNESAVQFVAGQELTHFRLHPGEEVRTPLMVLLTWSGDWIDGQNQWRRWMMAYGMPKPGGKLPPPIMEASSSRAYKEMVGADEASQIMHIDRYSELGLQLDYWWMDAGWYIQQHGWPQVGTWEVDPKRFPHGFKAISDHAHAKGVKTLVWFEPERVAPGTWLADNHPEWLLNPLKALEGLKSSTLGTQEPCVTYNRSDHEVRWNGIAWDAHSLSFHPGPKGEYSVVRFTAPEASEYRYMGGFTGIDAKTTTDVHILGRGEPVFASQINLGGHGRHAPFSGTVRLEKGETLDFVVGWGNGDYAYDSTGLDATVVGRDGVVHSASGEYRKSPWSYGALKPGAAPDAASFTAYDVPTVGGAGGNQLLDLGNHEAWSWLVEHIDHLLVANGIDLYRQDFNMDPLEFWRSNDAEDRQGITENKHVVGYLAYWDELRRRHPNMLIDSCASGGRRNDLETMRRAVPLWRSDYAYEPIGHQGMTYGLSMWLPFHGTGTVATTDAPYYGGGFTPVQPYAFWSNTAPSLGSGIDVRVPNIDYAELRRLFGAWRSIGKFYYGDFYPLTPYSQAEDAWIGWQFSRPEHGDALVLVFRRAKASASELTVKLRGLEPGATYTVDAAEGAALFDGQTFKGSELMSVGLTISVASTPGVGVYTLKKKQ